MFDMGGSSMETSAPAESSEVNDAAMDEPFADAEMPSGESGASLQDDLDIDISDSDAVDGMENAGRPAQDMPLAFDGVDAADLESMDDVPPLDELNEASPDGIPEDGFENGREISAAEGDELQTEFDRVDASGLESMDDIPPLPDAETGAEAPEEIPSADGEEALRESGTETEGEEGAPLDTVTEELELTEEDELPGEDELFEEDGLAEEGELTEEDEPAEESELTEDAEPDENAEPDEEPEPDGETAQLEEAEPEYEQDQTAQESPEETLPDLEQPPLDSRAYEYITDALDEANVEYRPLEPADMWRTQEEIIRDLSGGDLTEGSCSSLALAYAGNKAGYEVLDFRDGESRAFFSARDTISQIGKLPGVNAAEISGKNDLECANELIDSMVPEKEYYLATGGHAAIVRKTGDALEYLELQHPGNMNGWHPLDDYILINRFGCSRAHESAYTNYLMDVDSLAGSEEFLNILGYINTAKPAQKKGVTGNVR